MTTSQDATLSNASTNTQTQAQTQKLNGTCTS